MAPVKRKFRAEEPLKRPVKQLKLTPSRSIELSNSREEEPIFRRGGASILTPLEQRNIQIRAKQDAFYEQESGKKPATTLDSDTEEIDRSGIDDGTRKAPSTKSGSKSQSPQKHRVQVSPHYGIKIESLSYTRLAPGSIVLGQVSKINQYDIALSLPNNLTGYVPLTAISDILTGEVEASLEGSSSEKEDELNGSERHLDLHSLFAVGQYLRAFVTSTHTSTTFGGGSRRHIELSINPRKANDRLTAGDLAVNSTIQAEVLSVEDHGLIMNLGLESTNTKAFMSSRELGIFRKCMNIRPGAVLLCLVIGFSPNGNIVKLSADPERIGNLKKGNYLKDASTVNIFLPGTAVEVLITSSSSSGTTGEIMGLIDVTSDVIHSGITMDGKAVEKRYAVGSKVKARIICTFHTAERKKLGVSFLGHVIALSVSHSATSKDRSKPADIIPYSAIIDDIKVKQVESGYGLLVEVGRSGFHGFVHISRISDDKVEALYVDAGPYRVGSIHRGRVIGHNLMDDLLILSFEQSVLDLPFLSLEDLNVGQAVTGVVEKIVLNSSGVTGMLVKVAENINGFVPAIHLADVQLQYPEQKFKEGSKVQARVLSLDHENRQLRLTLKKTLVNSDCAIWKSFEEITVGMDALGTLVNITGSGAIVQFYGAVRGFLPVSQMSETYIQDPKQHFHTGQVVKVHVLSVQAAEQRMTVSCISTSLFGPAQEQALKELPLGSTVVGKVYAKMSTEYLVELEDFGLKAGLHFGHLVDGSEQKCLTAAKRIRVGQVLRELVVLNKNPSKRSIELTTKPSLIRAYRKGLMPRSFSDIRVGIEVTGYVTNITTAGIFVRFAGGLTGLLPVSQLSEDTTGLPGSGLHVNKTISAKVFSIDLEQQRFLLTRKLSSTDTEADKSVLNNQTRLKESLVNPTDGVSTSISDFGLGKITRARIISVKETQLNVHLADGIQGRVDVSAIFDSWEEIKDRKRPLKIFKARQVLPVRILGVHDSRNHRYLPITNRGKAPVFELTAKPKDLSGKELEVPTLDKVEIGSTWLCYVNNIVEDCLWVNLFPNVRGRISILDASDSTIVLSDLHKNFPIGSVLRAHVLSVDLLNGRLDLCARSSPRTLGELSRGMILPAKVTKVAERQIMVQLSDALSAPVHLVDIEDDFSKADPTIYRKGQIISVCVVDFDASKKKIFLSIRPSRLLSLSSPVKDPEISSFSQLSIHSIVRGFITNVTDKGLFVTISNGLTAFVRVSDLSDLFIKDWKAQFKIDQLVRGKVISLDSKLRHIQMSLKESVLDKHYKAPLTYSVVQVGDLVRGKVRKVEDFGIFIVINDSANVSGLCHRSEMAENPVKNVKELYSEGDSVEAKVLGVDPGKKRISFGLKTSYFEPGATGPESDEESLDRNGISMGIDDLSLEVESTENNRLDSSALEDLENSKKLKSSSCIANKAFNMPQDSGDGLTVGAFDWTGGFRSNTSEELNLAEGSRSETGSNKRRKRAEIMVDETGNLDADGPQSPADFERLLMGLPNSSYLWISYMALHLQLSDVSKARDVAERAIKTINHQSKDNESEALDVWVAFLNLENTHGTQDSLNRIFEEACVFNDTEEVHNRLTSIYIQSNKNEVCKIYSKAPRWIFHEG